MWVTVKSYFDQGFQTCLAFFKENNPAGSSKRLIAISSFFSGIGLCWASLLTGIPIDASVLSLTVTLLTLGTGNYLLAKKSETKKDATVDTKDGESKDGQG